MSWREVEESLKTDAIASKENMKTELCQEIEIQEKDPACPKCGERLDVYSNHGRTIIDCSACCHAVVDPSPDRWRIMCNICLAGGFCRPYIDYIPGN